MRNLDTTKYALVYPRQSTELQTRENVYSLERQLALRERASEDGFTSENIILIDDDLGLSGRSIGNRPGFQRALQLMEKRLVAAIYVEDLTRLSRDERTIDQMIIADACERSGALIYMGRSWYDMRDSGQRQAYKYQAVGFSEYWKAHLIKLHETRKEKARQGKSVTQLPRGYRANREGHRKDAQRDRLIIHEEEAAIIRSLVARLPEAGSARELFRQTHPTYWPDGGMLSRTHMSKILHHPIYRGHYVWGDIVVENNHEPIIGPEDAAMVDRVLGENKAIKRREPRRVGGLLAGLVWCSECKRKIGANLGHSFPVYRCDDGKIVDRDFHFSTDASKVDDLVAQHLFRHLEAGLLDRIIAQLETKRETIRAQDTGESQRRILQRKIDGCLKSISDPDLPDLARKAIQLQLDQAIRELDMHSSRTIGGEHIEEALDFYQGLRNDPAFSTMLKLTWGDEPIAWRRSWVRRFIERIVLTESSDELGIEVGYIDGESASLVLDRPATWGEKELALLQELWDHPERPARGWAEWIREQMESRGVKRSRHAIYHQIGRIRR